MSAFMATAGPTFIQIGNEGGWLPGVAVIPAQPVGYNYNRRDVTVLNVLDKGLFLGTGGAGRCDH